jgi:hypothetical protein
LGDYAAALSFWLRMNESRISGVVFVENSGYPLDELREVAIRANQYGREVEFLDASKLMPQHLFHYGFDELLMINEACFNSKLLRVSPHFVKTTGRLTFPRLPRLLNRLPPDYLFAVDCRLGGLFKKEQNLYACTELMLFDTEFYRHRMAALLPTLFGDDVTHLEKAIVSVLALFPGTDRHVLRWPVSVRKVGVGAHWNKPYGSAVETAKETARAVLRPLVPGLWI